MSQHYSEPERADDPYALPNIEVFYVTPEQAKREADILDAEYGPGYHAMCEQSVPVEAGWYWWACFPGCMPDGEPVGPYETEAEAIADAQSE